LENVKEALRYVNGNLKAGKKSKGKLKRRETEAKLMGNRS